MTKLEEFIQTHDIIVEINMNKIGSAVTIHKDSDMLLKCFRDTDLHDAINMAVDYFLDPDKR